MKVVIPLAGFGTRLRPHTYSKPKPLINVAGKPVLGHLLDQLIPLGVEEFIFVVGYLGDQIEEYVRHAYASITARFVEQREMLGQAHAIWTAREYLNHGSVFIPFADTLFEADLAGMDSAETDAFIYVREVEDPRSFGVVTLGDDGRITRFVEKPKTMDNRLAVVGLYYFRHGDVLLNAIEQLMAHKAMTNNEYFLADAMQLMVEDGNVFKTRPVWAWLDCGRPETVLETNRYLLGHGHDNSGSFKNHTSAIIIPPVNIDPSAQIEESVIGPYVTIAANAVISRCLLRDTIIDEGATCRDTLLEQSLVGRSALVTGRFRSVNVGDSSAVGYVG